VRDDLPENLEPEPASHLDFVAAAVTAGNLLGYELLDRGRRVSIRIKGARYTDAATRDNYVALAWDEMLEDEELSIVQERSAAKRIEDLAKEMRASRPEHFWKREADQPDDPNCTRKDRETVKAILRRLGKIPG
jgi:hypothetical protein